MPKSYQIAKSDFLSVEDIQDEGADGEQGGYKDRKFMEENRKIRNQVKKLISIFQG